MLNIFMVGIGGFFGAVARYLAAGWVQKFFSSGFYPVGTFVVNITGCLLIGFLATAVQGRQLFSPETRLLVLVGFLGGFTTFSTFSSESFNLLSDGEFVAAGLNVFLHVVLGLAAVWAGSSLEKLLAG